jgi:hypothetical protein
MRVRTAEQLVLEPVKLLSARPLKTTLEATHSVIRSLVVNVMDAVSPAFNLDSLEVIAMVGGVVSVAKERSLLLR